jgi:HEAT repeat protein
MEIGYLNFDAMFEVVMRIDLKGAVFVCAAAILLNYPCNLQVQAAESRDVDVQSAIQNLYNEDERERKSAAFTISEMGPEGKAAIPKLIELVQSDESMSVRGEAANALGKIGPTAAAAVPALIAFLESAGGGYERTYAAQSLGYIAKQPEKVVPVLLTHMNQDAEPVVRQLAARSLGAFAADARPALPDIIKAIKQGDKDMREAAISALASIPADKASVPAVTELLRDELDTARGAAARSLGGAGTDASDAVPRLITLLNDTNADNRKAAATALGSIGYPAKSALPVLKKALKDREVYDAAFDAINNIKNAKAATK